VARVGVLTFSDGRDFVHRDLAAFTREVEDELAGALRNAGHEVVRADAVVWTNESATAQARRVADRHPDLTIFNIPV
jgi:L-fucose isomerase